MSSTLKYLLLQGKIKSKKNTSLFPESFFICENYMKIKKEPFPVYSPSKSTRSESNYHVLEKNTLEQSFDADKTIFIQLYNRTIPIKIEKTEEESLTIGWLLSETIRRITDCFEREKEFKNLKDLDPKRIVSLETKEKILGVDYLLTCFEEKVAYLRDGMILVPKFASI